VDYTAGLANDISKKNARGVMKTIKRLGARFALVASIAIIHHAPNVRSLQIQMGARCSIILYQKLLLSYFDQTGQHA
jgi:hypothetical protein